MLDPAQPAGRRFVTDAVFHEALESRKLMSVNVTTYHYSNAETGSNTNETQLTLANVNSNSFGKIATLPVDGQIYGQPLIMTGVAMANGEGTHDIVIVATENDSVYAFDAYGNNPAPGYLWKTSLLASNETAVPESTYGTTDITPELGVTGTPVIDPTTGRVYVVGLFQQTSGSTVTGYSQRIYALNIASGTNAVAPLTISASVSGSNFTNTNAGYTNAGGVVAFSAYRENQRPALTLANGEVYVGWSSHGDQDPWHGWVIAFNAATLNEDYVYCDTTDGEEGGIWMSGGGIAVDSSGNIYFTTGNGTFDANSNTTVTGDYSMTIEKMSPSLVEEDYFAPDNEASLSGGDLDYGCANVILLTGQTGSAPNEILSAGKWGTIFLNNANTGSMGEFSSTSNNDLGQANITTSLGQSNVHNTIVYWNGSVYLGGDALPIEAFSVGNSNLSSTNSSETSHIFGSASIEDGQGAGLTVSSNGSSNGILWAADNSGFLTSPAILYAYNASSLSQAPLWTSSTAANSRDTASVAIKFQDPVVANGHVYLAGDGSLTVYGLLSSSTGTATVTTPASANPANITTTSTVATTTLSVLGTDPAGDLSPNYTWSATTVPGGAAAPTFSINATNNANVTTATFTSGGTYTLTVSIEDPNSGLVTTSSVNVTVAQTLTSIKLSPSSASVADSGTQQFTTIGYDQYGSPMATQPTFTWGVNAGGAGGTINSAGLYTAPASGTGFDTVTVTTGSFSAQALVSVAIPPATNQVNLSTYDNRVGIISDGSSIPTTYNGGIDNDGDAYSANLLGTSLTWNNSAFTIPAPTANNGTPNVVSGAGQVITIGTYKYATLKILAVHVNGNQPSSTADAMTVTYTDASTLKTSQKYSDWFTSMGYTGESVAAATAYRDQFNGSESSTGPFNIYGYSFALNDTKVVSTITLPSDGNWILIAMDLVGLNVTTAAAANPSTDSGTTTTLTAVGTSPSGDAVPTYKWYTTTEPAGVTAPTFAPNGTTSSSTSVATFHAAGAYVFTVVITDPTSGLSGTSSVSVTVGQTLTSIIESPTTARLADGATQQFTAIGYDQFGTALVTQPTFAYAVKSGGAGGTVNSSTGLYTAPATGTGTDLVNASSGSIASPSATITVVSANPTVTTAAAANPSTDSGTTTSLSVLGTDIAGDAAPIYLWAASTIPAGAPTPTFSPNNTASSNVSTATFYKAGAYTFTVTIKDPTNGLTSTSSVNVTVTQKLTSITESPTTATVTDGTTQQFTATAYDQFGISLTTQPSFVFAVKSGGVGGTVNASTGLYTAPATGTGTDLLNAGSGSILSLASTITVVSANPTVTTPAAASPSTASGTTTTLTVLGTDAAGDAAPLYTWAATNVPAGATTPTFSPNNSASSNVSTATFYQAGVYTFTVTIKDPTNGLTSTSSVNVTVNQTLTSVTVNPVGPVALTNGKTQQFTAVAYDQFSKTLVSQPSFTWTVVAGSVGSVSSVGLYSAPSVGAGSATVVATSGGVTGSSSVQVNLPAWLGAGSAATWNSSSDILTVTGPTSIVADPGADQPIIQANGSAAAVTINPAAATTLQVHIGGLDLTNGATAVVTSLGAARTAANHRVLVLGLSSSFTVPQLSIDSTSQLDLTDNDMVDHNGSLSAVTGLIASGFNLGAGYWNGDGIASSVAAAGLLNALGVANGPADGSFDGETVVSTDVEVRYTYYGDANLDGKIDGSDYSLIDAGYSSGTATGWASGDFNYDGVVDGTDYALIDNAFNNQAASLANSSALVAASTQQVAAAPAVSVAPVVKSIPTVAVPASFKAIAPLQTARFVPNLFSSTQLTAAAKSAATAGASDLVTSASASAVIGTSPKTGAAPAGNPFLSTHQTVVKTVKRPGNGDVVDVTDPGSVFHPIAAFAG